MQMHHASIPSDVLASSLYEESVGLERQGDGLLRGIRFVGLRKNVRLSCTHAVVSDLGMKVQLLFVEILARVYHQIRTVRTGKFLSFS